jgi:hypothetical protein
MGSPQTSEGSISGVISAQRNKPEVLVTGNAEISLFLHSWAMGLPCDRCMWPGDAYSNKVPGHSKENEKLVNNYQSTNTDGIQLRNWDMTMRLCFIFFRLISTQVLYKRCLKLQPMPFRSIPLWTLDHGRLGRGLPKV